MDFDHDFGYSLIFSPFFFPPKKRGRRKEE